MSFIGLMTILTMGVVYAMSRPGCSGSPTCTWEVFLIAELIGIPLIVILTRLWGRWYQQKSSFSIMAQEREFKEQVALVEWERQRLATVLNQMADGVIMTDRAGRILFINPGAERLLHTDSGDALGRSFSSVVYHHELIDLWQKCSATRTQQTAALEIDRRDAFVQAVVTPVRVSDNWNFLIILQDLTDIRRLETIRRDFISNVSHELLTPIAALRALVETLQDGAFDDPPAAKRFLARSEDEVDSLAQIVSELLTLSRIESGQVSLRLKAVDPFEILAPPIERLTAPAERKNITIDLDLPADLPPVLADVEYVWQVLTNLLHNGLKYTPAGGQITVSAAVVKRKKSVDGDPKENYTPADDVEFRVKDTGIGIPERELSRIFERFYKADRARQRDRASGTGLGLSIAKHIIQAHEGQIWVKSKEGKGSTFFFTLPVAVQTASTADNG